MKIDHLERIFYSNPGYGGCSHVIATRPQSIRARPQRSPPNSGKGEFEFDALRTIIKNNALYHLFFQKFLRLRKIKKSK